MITQIKAPETPVIADVLGTTTGKSIDAPAVMGYKVVKKNNRESFLGQSREKFVNS